ncbi:MAG TPA: hypothetical protein VKU00_21585 [Chthonomonadaceae bacterium]|nr:hypothetical protein [Chthonomonadaceae bacterium]
METLPEDCYLIGVALIGILIGFIVARSVRKTLLRDRSRAFQGSISWVLTLGFGGMAAWLAWQQIAPWYYIDTIEACREAGDPCSDWPDDRLAAMGARAIGPILSRVSGHRVFARGTCLLPPVLARIGPPAHRALLAAIDRESDPYERIGLIYTLREAFQDNSRLHLWIDYALRKNRTDPWLWNSVAQVYPDAPMMWDGQGGVSQEFAAWYEKHSWNLREEERR